MAWPSLAKLERNLYTAANILRREAKQVFVPLVVQVETVRVLESGYGLDKKNVVRALEHLELNQAFVLEDEDLSRGALALFQSCNADFSDCVILAGCRAQGLELYTFDKRLGRVVGVTQVPMS